MRQTVLELTWLDELAELGEVLTPAQLAEITAGFVSRPQLWRSLVHHDPASRWFERLLLTGVVEVWLIAWSPGQGTAVHDHGGSSGGMTVAEGSLVEEVFESSPTGVTATGQVVREAGASVGFREAHVHRVRNAGPANATSIHAYSPPGQPMREYAAPVELKGSVLPPHRPWRATSPVRGED
jgi:predicted metal-dependent enzyme (double-stranded beta helix superfamily)